MQQHPAAQTMVHRPAPPQYPPPVRRRSSFWRSCWWGCCMGNMFFFIFSMFIVALGLVVYVAAPPDTTTILLLGNDARPGTGEDQIARTDSIMVLTINHKQHEVSLFSLPRDVFIQSPRYGWLRANTVIRNAELSNPGSGIDEMVASMEYTFGMDIDGYTRVSFEGFVDVVDALGGVKIDVPKHIVDNEYPTYDYGIMRVEFFPGEQKMDGETALIYARTRHADDDYQRAGRQQQVMQAIMSKLGNPMNWYRIPGVMGAVFGNIETNLSPGEMLASVPGMFLYGRPGQIEQFVVDRDYIYRGNDGEALPNVNLIAPWIKEHME